jgi:hypothetical protein
MSSTKQLFFPSASVATNNTNQSVNNDSLDLEFDFALCHGWYSYC